MTSPSPLHEEYADFKKRYAIATARVETAALELTRRKEAARVVPLSSLLPTSWCDAINQKFMSTSALESLQEAQDEYQWAIYERHSRGRPVYPRPRALSPSNKSFNKSQTYLSQTQSCFFDMLPFELRHEVYLLVFGQLVIEIEVQLGGCHGPKGSADCSIFRQSRIDDVINGGYWLSPGHDCRSALEADHGYRPSILPLLRSCRRIYSEAIGVLYSTNAFKSHGFDNEMKCTQYLLSERLQTIRSFHFQLNLGNQWQQTKVPLQRIAGLGDLRKLCIVGQADIMVDGKFREMIDPNLWKDRKHELLPSLCKLSYIKDFDIFLPIMHSTLVLSGDERVGNCRLHGFTVSERMKGQQLECACIHKGEKREVPPLEAGDEGGLLAAEKLGRRLAGLEDGI